MAMVLLFAHTLALAHVHEPAEDTFCAACPAGTDSIATAPATADSPRCAADREAPAAIDSAIIPVGYRASHPRAPPVH